MPQVSSGSDPHRRFRDEHQHPSVRAPQRTASLLLCVLPRSIPANPLRSALTAYELETAAAWPRVSTLVRNRPCDLYVLYTPLGWSDGAQLCQRLRSLDRGTPLVFYSTQSSDRERREVLAAGAHAYVGRADGAQNLAGTVAQLIMLAELRSMEALAAHRRTFEERIAQHLAMRPAPRNRAKAFGELKREARSLFAQSGGSPANLERMWPALYARALSNLS